MNDKPNPDPCGVIAIFTSSDGRVVCTATDFKRDVAGGCKLWEGQKWRARQRVKWDVIRAYCSDAVVKSLDSYLCEQIADALCSKGDHKITYCAIGYTGEAQEYIERS